MYFNISAWPSNVATKVILCREKGPVLHTTIDTFLPEYRKTFSCLRALSNPTIKLENNLHIRPHKLSLPSSVKSSAHCFQEKNFLFAKFNEIMS